MIHDFCVIGGGIVGLAVARALLRRAPGSSLVLLEKEAGLGLHQTGHNSGVIHAGIYYAPGSLKSELCRRGHAATLRFCDDHAIPYQLCGKTIVATDARELAGLTELEARARRNAIPVERIGASELRRREPNVIGLGALVSPRTGIVDYRQICIALAAEISAGGGTIVTASRVTAITETGSEVTIRTGTASWTARQLVACAGLQSDRVARLAGLKPEVRIVPIRGEYYALPQSRAELVRSLIYPVPDPALPFLGVHLTRTIEGGITVGPNAVPGLAREGYPRFSVNLRDTADLASFPGTWRLARAQGRFAALEFARSVWKPAYLAQLRRYCPTLTQADLLPYPAGIRAQAVRRDGTLVEDFLWAETPRMLHVLNAPSPAATSAIPIGETIAERCCICH
jgi:L-2-hydroxyglutarate oxidase